MRSIKLSLIAVLAAALLAVPAVASAAGPSGGESAAAAKDGYKVNVHIQMSGGMKGPIYAWDPIMISVRRRGHSSERYDFCMTPGPLAHADCYKNRHVNSSSISTEPSKAGKLRLRFQLSAGKVLVRTLRIHKKK